MSVAVISEQGYRRTMEDAHYLNMNFGGNGWIFGGVYDGHSGGFAAKFAADNLHMRFLKEISLGRDYDQAFVNSFHYISDSLKDQESGTTAATFLLRDGIVSAANVGDSRILIVGKETHVQLTEEHRLDNMDERKRIVQSGGEIKYPYVMRGFQGLMTTRNLGDDYFHPVGVISTPAVRNYRLKEDDLFLLNGCDGLFDIISNNEVAELSRKESSAFELAEQLKSIVLEERRGLDNLTIIVLKLKGQEQ